MKLTDEWFTALSESEAGQLIFLSGRLELEDFRLSGKLKVRVEIVWRYQADATGMPSDEEGETIAQVEELLRRTMERDKLAILTGNYLGAGEKTWVWYTRHLPTFGERLNEALAPYEQLPLEIECIEDVEWGEYLDLLSMRAEEE